LSTEGHTSDSQAKEEFYGHTVLSSSYAGPIQSHGTPHRREEPLSIQDMARVGLYEIKTGQVFDQTTGQHIGLKEAIERGLVDKDSIRLSEPHSGKLITLSEAFERGIMDAETGDLVDSFTGKTVSMAESVRKALLGMLPMRTVDELWNEEKRCFVDPLTGRSITLTEALDKGLVDGSATTVRDPRTSAVLPLSEALHLGLVNPQTGDILAEAGRHRTFKEAFESGEISTVSRVEDRKPADQSRREETTTVDVRPVHLADAIKSGLFNERRHTFRDPRNGQELTLEEAINRGLVDAESPSIFDPESAEMISLRAAIEKEIVDGESVFLAPDEVG